MRAAGQRLPLLSSSSSSSGTSARAALLLRSSRPGRQSTGPPTVNHPAFAATNITTARAIRTSASAADATQRLSSSSRASGAAAAMAPAEPPAPALGDQPRPRPGQPPPVLRVDPAHLPPVEAGPGTDLNSRGDGGAGGGAATATAAAAGAMAGSGVERERDDPWWRLRYPLPAELRVTDNDDAGEEDSEEHDSLEQGPGNGSPPTAAAAAAATVGGGSPDEPTRQTSRQQQQQQQPAAARPTRTSSARAVRRAARLLRGGLPVALPTETVYGLACDATSADAARRVFVAKGRPQDNPLIVHVASLEMLLGMYPPPSDRQEGEEETEAEAVARVLRPPNDALARAFWPGPLTLLLPASPLIPSAVTAGHGTVAVRMPAHPVARAVIAAAGVPIAAPSANASGRPSPTEAAHVAADFAACGRGHMVPLVLDAGACACGVESTVAQARGWEEEEREEGEEAGEEELREQRRRRRPDVVVLRPGGVTPEQIEAALAREYGGQAANGREAGLKGEAANPASSSSSPPPRPHPRALLPPSVVVYGLSSGAARDAAFEAAPTTPGMKYRHYSPDAPVLLVEPPQGLFVASAGTPGAAAAAAAAAASGEAEAEAEAEATWRAATASAVLRCAAALLPPQGGSDAGKGVIVVLLRTTLPPCAPEGWQQPPPGQQQQQQQQQQAGGGGGGPAASGGGSPDLESGPAAPLAPPALAAAGVARVFTYNLGPWRAPEAVARRLFAGLRAADGAGPPGATVIVAEGVPSSSSSSSASLSSASSGQDGGSGGGVGVAVMNRLRKAAARVVVAA